MKPGSLQNGMISFVLVLSLLMAPVALPFTSKGARHDRGGEIKTFAHPSEKGVTDAPADKDHLQTPAYFEENQGQLDPEVKFIARGTDCSLFLTSSEAVYVLSEQEGKSASRTKLPEPTPVSPATITKHALHMGFAGAGAATISGAKQLSGVVNYLKGNDSARWHTNIPTYEKVQYEDLYPGIDLVYYTKAHQLEYDFVVAPGADAGQIALSFSGADSVKIDDGGDLVLKMGSQALTHQKPHAYQEINGVRREVASSYQLTRNEKVSFSLGAYDHALPLTIDPLVLGYSTYLGGAQDDEISDIAIDPAGSAIFVTGFSRSDPFPTTSGAFQTTLAGASDAFVTKFNPGDNTFIYCTYIGGGGNDFGAAIALDSSGNAYITGTTNPGATPFPTTAAAFQPNSGGGVSDAFVTELNSTGTAPRLFNLSRRRRSGPRL